jgi:Holliday junction resolvase RusA-like endonuclease
MAGVRRNKDMSKEIIDTINLEVQKNNPDFSTIKALLLDLYYEETGKEKRELDELGPQEFDDLVKWANLKEIDHILDFWRRQNLIEKVFHQSLSSKVGVISQAHCRFCTQDYPLVLLNIRIRPQSYQALKPNLKRAFKNAVHSRIRDNYDEFKNGRVCLHIVFVCSTERKEKDVDNMSKILVDSLKTRLMADDVKVDHLSVMKILNYDNEEFVTVNVRKSRLNEQENQLSPYLHHSWRTTEMLELEAFL